MRTPLAKTLTLIVILAFTASKSVAQPVREQPRSAAFLKSLVVPGWGQYELGMKNTTVAFVTAEAVMIGSILALRSYGKSTRTDYKALASAHAGVRGDHPHDFYVDVGNWMNVDQYNQRRLQERDFDALYTSAEDHWQWDSNINRARMKELRIASDRAFQNVVYAGGALVLNHIFSAIHAGRMAAREQSGAGASSGLKYWQFSVTSTTNSRGVRFGLSRAF